MTDLSCLPIEFTLPLATTIEYYAERLAENEKALSFLRRNLLSADAGSESRLRRSNARQSACRHINRVKGNSCASSCKAVGILKPTGHETFRGYVTVR